MTGGRLDRLATRHALSSTKMAVTPTFDVAKKKKMRLTSHWACIFVSQFNQSLKSRFLRPTRYLVCHHHRLSASRRNQYLQEMSNWLIRPKWFSSGAKKSSKYDDRRSHHNRGLSGRFSRYDQRRLSAEKRSKSQWIKMIDTIGERKRPLFINKAKRVMSCLFFQGGIFFLSCLLQMSLTFEETPLSVFFRNVVRWAGSRFGPGANEAFLCPFPRV